MGISTKELRRKAVAAYKTGTFTQKHLAEAYGVHYKTLYNWIKADRNGEPEIQKKRGCRPRIFSEAEELEILELIQSNPAITLEAIKDKLQKSCNVSVVHRTLMRLKVAYKKNAKGVRAKSR